MAVGLSSTDAGGPVIYTVNGGAGNAPDWLAKRGSKKGKGRATEDLSNATGIRLIQDLDFPEASNKIKSSRDGRFLLATGTYKPRMKVFELDELGMKLERTTDAENVDFEILSDDWTKTLHLQSDRSVEVHNQASAFYRTRIPKAGRAIAYHFPSCDALVGGLGGHLYRLNLEQGRFLSPFALAGNPEEGASTNVNTNTDEDDLVTGINAININPAHQLISLGTETALGQGTVEFWDPRVRRRVGILKLPYAKLASSTSSAAVQLPGLSLLDPNDASLHRPQVSVTALSSRHDGLNLAVGTSTGHTLLYDLRTTRPYTIKDQGYGLPIKKIEWPLATLETANETDGPLVATADEKVVKIWSSSPDAQAKNLVAITAPAAINDMHIYPRSGLIFLANEQSAMTGYYVPALGQAPRWCRFLDNMTEEMEDDQSGTVYEDYKFVDRKELEALQLDHLIGTPTLRPYMHGFFISLKLYIKAKAIANPFAYAEHRQKLIAERLEKERESRIRSKGGRAAASASSDKPVLPSGEKVVVNKSLVDRLRAKEEKEKSRKRKRGEEAATAVAEEEEEEEVPALLADDRFGSLFTNPEYAIDETSKEYAMVNPSAAAHAANRASAMDQDEEEDEEADSDSSAENDLIGHVRPTKQQRSRDVQLIRDAEPSTGPRLTIERSSGERYSATAGNAARQNKTLGELKNAHSGRHVGRGSSGRDRDNSEMVKSLAGGGMEMSFMPATSSKSEDDIAQKKQKMMADKRKKSQFGYGLEKGSAAERQMEQEATDKLGQDDRSGRTHKRHGVRSASSGKIKRMTQAGPGMKRAR